jgi:ABC-2 type transport system ATP-binding protein
MTAECASGGPFGPERVGLSPLRMWVPRPWHSPWREPTIALMGFFDAAGSVPALRTDRLGRRYGKAWGLRDCTVEVPSGAVAALVGPNGAGKTTLLEMIIGLLEPTEGQVSVFGQTSRAGTTQTLARVGYVAQDHPLYRDFTVADMFHLGRAMNPSWDQELAAARVDALDIPLNRKIKRLSGGQRAQVSLTMALAKRAPMVVLDEPVSSLDPVARLEFMRDVMAAAADHALTFLISSHVVSELERFCDWLIVLANGRMQLAGPAADLLAAHRLLTVPRATPGAELPGTAIHRTDSDRHSTVLVRTGPAQLAACSRVDWQDGPVSFEQLVMAYLQRRTPLMTHDDPGPAAERPGPSTKADAR